MTIVVWYQLHLRESPRGDPGIVTLQDDALITHLKKAVKEERKNALKCFDAEDLTVYAVGVADRSRDDTRLYAGYTVPSNTTSRKPLIVIAQEQNGPPVAGQGRTELGGELSCCYCCSNNSVNVLCEYILLSFWCSLALYTNRKHEEEATLSAR